MEKVQVHLKWTEVRITFGPALEAVRQRLEDEWDALHANGPSEWYHYTTVEGLRGILSNQELWFTNIAYLNDASEATYGRDLLLRILESKRSEYPHDEIQPFFDGLREHFCGDFPSLTETYVTCFCENGNLLSQWRHYADSGGGYSIGLHISKDLLLTPNILSGKASRAVLRRVIYKRDEQEEILGGVIDGLCGLMVNDIEEGNVTSGFSSDYHTAFINIVDDWLYCFKDEAFSEEMEWRLIDRRFVYADESKYLKFRSSRGHLIPYIAMQLVDASVDEEPYFPIKKIWIGPTLRPELSKKAVRMFLANHGYRHSVEIEPSLIPLQKI